MSQRTPVIVGVGQIANKDPERILHPDDLLHSAIELALADAGTGIRSRIDSIFATPPTHDDAATIVARLRARADLDSRHAETMRWSGSGPQEGLNRAVTEIAEGRLQTALLVAGVGDASVKRARQAGREPLSASTGLERNFEVDPDLPQPPDRPRPPVETAAGVRAVGTSFAMVESVFAAGAGRSLDEQRMWLGELLAPFTAAAARRPEVAWFAQARSAAEISGVSPTNRLVNEPYTKVMNAFPTVDLAASLVITTTEVARASGIPERQWIYPWAGTTCHEPAPPSERPYLHRPAGLAAAMQRVLAAAQVGVADVDRFDFYSCFPSAVQMAADAVGLDPLDRRGLTVTGGLPYFGGPGAAYVLHAIVSMVEECRARPASTGMVVGLGGLISHFAAGIYSSAEPPRPWSYDACADVEAELDRQRVPVDLSRQGIGEVEAMTVAHNRTEPVNAPVIVRFPDGSRTGARPRSREMARDLSGCNLVGRQVRVALDEGGPRYEVV